MLRKPRRSRRYGFHIALAAPVAREDRRAWIGGQLPLLLGLGERNVTSTEIVKGAGAMTGNANVPAGIGAERRCNHGSSDARDVVAVSIHRRDEHGIGACRVDDRW